MSLRLQYQGTTTLPIEIEGLLPESVRQKSLAEIERLPIFHGNRSVPLAEFFHVSGDPGDLRFEFEGNLSAVHWIGAGMREGSIRVSGDAGRHLGSEMTGGEIQVEGIAGDWAGGEMHGGTIQVRGHAGHFVGAAYRGSPCGMRGGTIVIGGDAGNECGHSMRRGMLAIGGSVGDFTAMNMLAGSVFVFGNCGNRPAAGMRRGTLALFGEQPPALLPTFRRAGVCQPQFMRVYLRALVRLGLLQAERYLSASYTMFSGDQLAVGRGEILLASI
jgi:formylmethanofuran dehydrogenase subunit C